VQLAELLSVSVSRHRLHTAKFDGQDQIEIQQKDISTQRHTYSRKYSTEYKLVPPENCDVAERFCATCDCDCDDDFILMAASWLD